MLLTAVEKMTMEAVFKGLLCILAISLSVWITAVTQKKNDIKENFNTAERIQTFLREGARINSRARKNLGHAHFQ